MANVYLGSTVQTQLTQLKAINQIPLQRIDAKSSVVNKEKTAVSAVSKELTDVKTAFNKLKGTEAPSADAVAAFIKEFNELQTMLTKSTSKDGALMGTREARDARSDIRRPFSELSVLSGMRQIGVVTTREGVAAGEVVPTAAMSEDVVAAMEGALKTIETKLSSATTRMDSKLDALGKEKERASVAVARADKRTETNFLKYYQLMQQITANNNGTTPTFGAFG